MEIIRTPVSEKTPFNERCKSEHAWFYSFTIGFIRKTKLIIPNKSLMHRDLTIEKWSTEPTRPKIFKKIASTDNARENIPGLFRNFSGLTLRNRLFSRCVIKSRGQPLGQSCAQSGSERCPPQNEDHSGSRPHSFPGLYPMRSGMSPERFRSGPELAIRKSSRRDSPHKRRFSVLLNSGTTCS